MITMNDWLADMKKRIDDPTYGRFGRKEGWELWITLMTCREQLEMQAKLFEQRRQTDFERRARDFKADIRGVKACAA
jgi:hypothetical protein